MLYTFENFIQAAGHFEELVIVRLAVKNSINGAIIAELQYEIKIYSIGICKITRLKDQKLNILNNQCHDIQQVKISSHVLHVKYKELNLN